MAVGSAAMTLGIILSMSGARTVSEGLEGIRKQFAELGRFAEKARATGAVMMGMGMATGGAIANVASSFAALEDASAKLRVTLMDKHGVAAGFEEINELATRLGTRLPGTTQDFIALARALKEQGVATHAVLSGGLEAAAGLKVVLDMPGESAAEMTAKLREAYQLTDTELVKMADLMQRTKFAFGIKPSDLMAASAYQAPMLNQLGVSGLDNANKMLAIQGMAARVGLEGSSFGTNFSMMLSRLAKGPAMIEMASKGMKGVAKDIMDTAGVKFDFFDEKGNFAGIDTMVSELEKLQAIKEKLGDKAAMTVAEALFGQEAARPAMILAGQGTKGYAQALKDMADQASLTQRVDTMLGTLAAMFEAAAGLFENMKASLGAVMGDDLKELVLFFGFLSESIKNLITENPTFFKWLGRLAILFTVLALTAGTFLLTIGLFGASLGAAGTAITLVAGVVKALGAALMLLAVNPVFLLIAAGVLLLVGLVYVIYKHWAPISAFFKNLWEGITRAFREALDWIDKKIQACREWVDSLSNLLPDWMKTENSTIRIMGDPLPSAGNAAGKESLEGHIKIEVSRDGSISMIRADSNNPNIPMNVGYIMPLSN